MKRSLAILLLFCCTLSMAQKVSIDKVLEMELRNFGPIYQDKQVKGYYMFYLFDKVDRKTNDYLLKILDENLAVVGEKHLEGSRKMFVEDAGYDNMHIMLKLVEPEDRSIRYVKFDETAKEVYRNDQTLDKKDFVVYQQISNQGLMGSNNISAIPDVGFVSMSATKPGKPGYRVEFFSQNGGKKYWMYETPGESFEYASFVAGDSALIYLVVMRKEKLMSNAFDLALQAMNTKTGKVVFETPLRGQGSVIWPTNVILKNNELLVIGSQFEDDDKIMKAKSKGLGIMTVNTKGKITKQYALSWDEVGGKIKAEAEVKRPSSIFFHNVIAMPTGNYLFVGESYHRTVDAGKVALNVASAMLSGRTAVSNSKLLIDDMVLLELTPDMKLQNVHLYEKASNNAYLPSTDFVSLALLGNIAKAYNAYDYINTQTDVDNPNRFSVNYLDYAKLEDAKSKQTYYGSIVYNNGSFTVDKLPLTLNRKTTNRVYPAKPGYVLKMEYNKQEKQINLDLVKIKA